MLGLVSIVLTGWDFENGISSFIDSDIKDKVWLLSGIVAFIALMFTKSKYNFLFFLMLVGHVILGGFISGFRAPLGGVIQGPDFANSPDWGFALGDYYTSNFQWVALVLLGILHLITAVEREQTIELALENAGFGDSVSDLNFYWQAELHPENKKKQSIVVFTKSEILLIPYSSAIGATKESVSVKVKDVEKIEYGLVHNRRWEGRIYHPEKYLGIAIYLKNNQKYTRFIFLGTTEEQVNEHFPAKISQLKSLNKGLQLKKRDDKETETGRKLIGIGGVVFDSWD